MSNFEPNAIIRGTQLTIVGALRALRNPELFKSQHYKQAALAVCAGIAIRILVAIPAVSIKIALWLISLVVNLDAVTWDDAIIAKLSFFSDAVLQVPFLLMTLMSYITPTLDEMFMESLRWVDTTYVQKHKSENPENLRGLYYPNLVLYSRRRGDLWASTKAFAVRYSRRTLTSLIVYFLSLLPVVGRFVLPAASFYTFHRAVGPVPAAVIFGTGLVLPRWVLVYFLQSYFASRSLMRELLEPYFSRIPFTREQKRRWFHDREGVLFGFAIGFYLMLKIPLLGVLMYGVAEASAAYLITKVTDTPPVPALVDGFPESQIAWKNKHAFLKLPLDKLDLQNLQAMEGQEKDGKKRNFPLRESFS
ncbi:hypothetical protein VTO42DRAFT_4395 [Malbranchea cinnamomea]